MKKRLFLYTTLILIVGLLSYFEVSVYAAHTNNLRMAKDSVVETTQLCADLYPASGDLTAFVKAGDETRITVISSGGEVLADSLPLAVRELENHLDRPEIRAAESGTPQTFVRYSETLGTDLIYYAVKVEVGDSGAEHVFLRCALPVEKIDGYLWQSLPLLILLLVLVSVICFFLVRYMIRKVTLPFESIQGKLSLLASAGDVSVDDRSTATSAATNARATDASVSSAATGATQPAAATQPTNAAQPTAATQWATLEGTARHSKKNGPTKPRSASSSFPEIDRVTRDIDEVADKLQLSMLALRDEKAKLDYILDNIGDGIFVVDETKSIVLINSVALEIFDASTNVTEKNLTYLSFDKAIALAVEAGVEQEKSTALEAHVKGRIYYVSVKRLPKTPLTMVALTDVTEARMSANRREEFFANASHELKTPLTAIKGFNELTDINNSDAGIQKYIDSISRETDRMLALIGDMLKLSKLENIQELNPTAVSLKKTVDEVRETLSSMIADSGVNFEVIGDAEVRAEQSHVYELVKNLVENAVRYTGAGGQVSVCIEDDGPSPKLTVADNGIGISAEEQTRIFERFYRVEKSRSQQNGGTGLGLAIVKHICVLYDWQLALKSKLGVGTEATIVF